MVSQNWGFCASAQSVGAVLVPFSSTHRVVSECENCSDLKTTFKGERTSEILDFVG